jgi:hypothetical protein
MTRDDFIERLEEYLDGEGVTPLPDGVRSEVRAALPSIKQGGPGGPLRFDPMTFQIPAAARFGLAAAAVVAAIAIGAGFLLRGDVGDDDPTLRPSASAAASAAASVGGPMSLLDSPRQGDLPAGEYLLDHEAYPALIQFTVPEGWWYYWTSASRAASDVHAILVNNGVGDGYSSAWGLGFSVVNQVRADPCDAGAGYMDGSVTESAETLAAAFETWTDFSPTTEDVTIGGFPGKRVELSSPDGSDCVGGLFTTPTGYRFDMPRASEEPFDNPHQFTSLDVDGSVIVIWTTDHPGSTGYEVANGASPDPEAHATDQVELDAILDSIVFTPR